VLTTLAAFLPLMLLPGILGKFMRVIPLVVSLSLIISLVEAFWMMPAHMLALRLDLTQKGSRLQPWRLRFLRKFRHAYARLLLRVLSRPRLYLALFLMPLVAAVAIVATGVLRMDFFAADPFPVFYLNVEMASGTDLSRSLATTRQVEERAMSVLRPGELRASVAYAGQMMTDTEPLFGKKYGQVMFSLEPDEAKRRPVEEIITAMREAVSGMPGPERLQFLKLSGGPPVTKPISIKVRGDDFDTLLPAAKALEEILGRMPEVHDIGNDFANGLGEVTLRLNDDAVLRAGLQAGQVVRMIRLFGDGEVVSEFQHNGEKMAVRVMGSDRPLQGVDDLLRLPVAVNRGESVPLSTLTLAEVRRSMEMIHHYNYRRTITVEAELDKSRLDIVAANNRVRQAWQEVRHQYPEVSLDFSGILDDIEESMDHITTLFIFGVGLMAMILGAQFVSYGQPLLILTTVPIAFTGVVFGLLLAGHPLSLYTLYGVVALSGIAVNSSIVLISAANDRMAEGMGPVPAAIFAARRRLVPILITTLTTMAGLMSLATGLAGSSLMWGPVATAIVWGLGFSTTLTLFLMPLLYITFRRRAYSRAEATTRGVSPR
ncbi:MAG: efflux RND transporter permease subunit, partial [Magnetococcales bacterium]|nr:efflux RND transporter permease subunit [Magnetococcales bacterium]